LRLTASEAFHNHWAALDVLHGDRSIPRVPRVLAVDTDWDLLSVETIEGRRFGAERPHALADGAVLRAIVAAKTITREIPRDARLAALPVAHHLHHHTDTGLLSPDDAHTLAAAMATSPIGWAFAHGAFSPGVIVAQPQDAVAVTDWKQAGIYPTGWDLAYLWFTTRAIPDARHTITTAVANEHRSSFWLSALLIVADHVDEAHNSAGPTRYLDADRHDLTHVMAQLAVIARTGSTTTISRYS
jgi:hypothetical protein